MSEMDPKQSRREFFRSGARVAALGVLGAVAALLGRRAFNGPGQAVGKQTCSNQFICSGCASFDGCGLPQALSRREAMSRRP